MRIIVGISGASGAILGCSILKALRAHKEVETHLIITDAAKLTLSCETALTAEDAAALADYSYDVNDMAARVASGSFETDGMIIAPCSMKTLSGIANGYDENLLIRAADATLKEGRKLVLAPRESPLARSHLRNMLRAAEDGAVILPPMLTFYHDEQDVKHQIDHFTGKALMQFYLKFENFRAWDGPEARAK
ncbi:MAG: UbiX family flavin prenyltransferase [Cloacibacillus sp.]